MLDPVRLKNGNHCGVCKAPLQRDLCARLLFGLGNGPVTRQDLDGKPPGGWRAEEKLDRKEALALFTSGAAWAAFEEDRRGRLAPGFDADLTVLDGDPVTVPPERIPKIRAVATFVGGKLVHGDAR